MHQSMSEIIKTIVEDSDISDTLSWGMAGSGKDLQILQRYHLSSDHFSIQ